MISKNKLLNILEILKAKWDPRTSMYTFISWRPEQQSALYDIIYSGIHQTVQQAKTRKLEKQQKIAATYSIHEPEFTEEELDKLLETI